MAEKKTILVLIDWFLPGNKAGGPVKSVSSLVRQLKQEFNFRIISVDTDLGEKFPYPGIVSNKWIDFEPGIAIYYFSKENLSFANLNKLLRTEKFEILYLNSLFSRYFSIYPLIIRKLGLLTQPVVIAPRGMLAKGALSLKTRKKKSFITICKLLNIHNNLKWHATNQQEVEDIFSIYGREQNVVLAPNLTTTRELKMELVKRKVRNEVRFFFLSRIVENKNVLKSLLLLLKAPLDVNVQYDIFGPIEDKEYWEQCKQIIQKLPPNIKVSYKGVLSPESVQEIISTYHFLVLLSYSENFGHSIVESLLSGCPVLISDQTPWKNLEVMNAGWDVNLNNEEKLSEAINSAISMDEATYNEWSTGAIKYARTHCIPNDSIEKSKSLFV